MIRTALPGDRDEIMEIYAIARAFMRSAGNPTQWGDTEPTPELVDGDLALKQSYVLELDGKIQAVFAMIPGDDPTYREIEGAWLNDLPYAAVHRVASRGEVKGLTGIILDWAMELHDNIRIDTHDDNIPMQRALARAGFTPCGRIIAEDGFPRIAYHKVKGA